MMAMKGDDPLKVHTKCLAQSSCSINVAYLYVIPNETITKTSKTEESVLRKGKQNPATVKSQPRCFPNEQGVRQLSF